VAVARPIRDRIATFLRKTLETTDAHKQNQTHVGLTILHKALTLIAVDQSVIKYAAHLIET
jgi:hypothetical protein